MKSDVGLDHGVQQGIAIRIKTANPAVPMPFYASEGAAGADVHAWIPAAVILQPGERQLISTGLFIEIPSGYEIQVRSRSGSAIRDGLFVVNSPGTIDSDYRGEIKIILANIGAEAVSIQPLERIAQFVLSPVLRARFEQTPELSKTSRDAGGFGSSGR